VTFTQDPACGYTYTATYAFTTTNSVSYISAGTVIVPSVEIYTQDGSNSGTETVTMATTITVAGGQGQSTTSLSNSGSVVPDVTFDVVSTNPCLTATVNDIVFSPTSLSVNDGATGTATFTIP
jgi:hypothetical protein